MKQFLKDLLKKENIKLNSIIKIDKKSCNYNDLINKITNLSIEQKEQIINTLKEVLFYRGDIISIFRYFAKLYI
jgi:hypothetical protein